ncbi:hypothetical protein [Tropicimonas sp. IMCC34043]|uniref:hypothetical protein n=1 Tax=Tropicimonas sp. IMCC34043 TaxID=2248760 RepID=UPI000E2645D8|nr:hypothetical protein [Tropicimonas sp. IMCC34043]
MTDPAEGDGLRPLTDGEAALVARYPLPEGAVDVLLNRAQLAVALDVSEVTITNWTRRGLPFESEGTNGKAYQFRLSIAHAWNKERVEGERARDQAAEQAAQQMRLALVGEDGLSIKAGLSRREHREQLELEHAAAVAALDRKELVKRVEVVGAFEEVFAALRDALDALPDRLARELGIGGAEVEVIERACDDALSGAVAKVEGLIGQDGTGGL